jgi:branched-chain amino acid transport system permease protein
VPPERSEVSAPPIRSEGSASQRSRAWLAALLAGGRGAAFLPVVLAAVAIAFPWISGDRYWIRQIALIAVFSLVVSGVNISFGYAGEVQFGQLFMFAVGGYMTAALATRWTDELIPMLVIGGIAATIVAAVLAIPAVRVGGWALAIGSFYLVISLPSFLRLLEQYTGGFDGVPVPAPKLVGHVLTDTGLYVTVIVVTALWFALYRNLVRSRYGVIFRTLRESPILASSIGYSPRRLKVLAYALSGFPAGAAGCLYAYLSQFLIPEFFTVSVAIGLIAAAVLGGVESVYGAVVGAALLQLGPMSSLSFQNYATVAYGAFLIIAGIVFRRGLGGIGIALGHRIGRVVAPDVRVARSIAAAPGTGVARAPVARDRRGEVLSIEGVSKAFAGVQALADVSLTAEPGTVTALIGSNGSGKTTLLNVICGYIQSDSGKVDYGDARLTGRSANGVARMGVGRTFQTPKIPRGVSVLDAVASGRFTSDSVGLATSMLRLPPYWRARREDRDRAFDVLELVGLAAAAEEEAGKQPLGRRRLIEVARMLCGDASLLLLDEPASGLSEAEVENLGRVITVAAEAGATVMLIEHNFSFVTSVSRDAYVLHLGRLIAAGPAATIGEDPAVIESYLGTSAEPEKPLVADPRSETPV